MTIVKLVKLVKLVKMLKIVISETCEPVEKVILLSVLCCMVTKSAPKWELTLMSVPYSEKIKEYIDKG